jgi:hypothetical protein
MLPLSRPDGSGIEPVPMARVERLARTEDETYSPAKEEEGDSQSQGRELGSEDRDRGDGEEGQPDDVGASLTERSFGAAPAPEISTSSSAKISFFA